MQFQLSFNSLIIGISVVSVCLVCSQTPPKTYSSYLPYPLCDPSDYIRYPKTTCEVVAIVKEAIFRGVKVKAFGSRHSQTDIICTGGIPVDMRGLKWSKMNSDNKTATFGPGVTVREAMDFLQMYGRALKTIPAYGGITLAGALGTGAHGSSIKHHSSISAQVAKMTIVDGHGQIQEITNPQDLNAFKIHLGLLGIVVEVTLKTVPLYKVLGHSYIAPDVVLTNGTALNWARTADQLMFYWFPSMNKVVVGNFTFVPVNTPGNASNQIIASPTGESSAAISSIKETAFDLASNECPSASTLGYKLLHLLEMNQMVALVSETPGREPYFSEDGVTFLNPAVGFPNVMLTAVGSVIPDNKVVIDLLANEFGIDVDDMPAAIKVIKDVVAKAPTAFPLSGILLRFSAKNDIYMSTSYGRDTLNLELVLWKRTDYYNKASGSLAGPQTIAQALVDKFRGRSHWGKSGLVFHSRDALDQKLDPTARLNFIAAMKRFDPEGIFVNNFARRILQKGCDVDADPLATRCALLDYCFCTKNSDCGPTQICTFVKGYPYYVCKTRNIAPPEQLDRNELAEPFNASDFYANTLPQLLSGAEATCST